MHGQLASTIGVMSERSCLTLPVWLAHRKASAATTAAPSLLSRTGPAVGTLVAEKVIGNFGDGDGVVGLELGEGWGLTEPVGVGSGVSVERGAGFAVQAASDAQSAASSNVVGRVIPRGMPRIVTKIVLIPNRLSTAPARFPLTAPLTVTDCVASATGRG